MGQHNIAIIIQNIIQWYSIRPLAKLLEKQADIKLDILIFDPPSNDADYSSIALHVEKIIHAEGFITSRKPRHAEYKICLAPYSDMITFKAQYRLGYCYGAATTKPHLTSLPEFKIGFHGFFLHDTYDAELFSVYGKTYIVPDLYLRSINHKKASNKPVVLFLPTYHEPSTINTAKTLSKLKDKYYIIVKSHHGTDSLNEEKTKKDLLLEIANEYYDSDQYIMPLLDKADVVLSDNSGAVMDALYSKVPVSITTPTLCEGLNGIPSLQTELIAANIIPYSKTQTTSHIDKILKQALSASYIKRQTNTSDQLFPSKTGGAQTWYNIIKKYLNDDIDQNYCKLHDYYSSFVKNLIEQQRVLQNERANLMDSIKTLNSDISTLKAQLDIYQCSRAHRILENILSNHHRKQQEKNHD